MIDMERKIGEIFEFGGEWYQCVECNSCGECSLLRAECSTGTKSDIYDKVFGKCSRARRADSKHAVFKKLEKVGEPYAEGNSIVSERMFQKYRTYEKNFFLNERDLLFTSYGDIVSIEIKQNKEDMEENNAKHSNSESIGRNLKPFDLEAARSGKPVCTRDGRKARIICFDVKAKKPIAALITNDDTEEVHFYYDNGRSDQYLEYRYDLMMLPEKKEGWVNVYKGGLLDTKSYPTKKEAFDKACPEGYIDTIKISWEE